MTAAGDLSAGRDPGDLRAAASSWVRIRGRGGDLSAGRDLGDLRSYCFALGAEPAPWRPTATAARDPARPRSCARFASAACAGSAETLNPQTWPPRISRSGFFRLRVRGGLGAGHSGARSRGRRGGGMVSSPDTGRNVNRQNVD